MDDETATEIADAALASRGLPLFWALRAGVVQRPAPEVIEVTFSAGESLIKRGFEGNHRVFIGPEGHYIGVLQNDGTPPAFMPFVPHIPGEQPIPAADRYLRALLRWPYPTSLFVPRIIDAPDIVCVYYAPAEENVFGGEIMVYIVATGVVVNVIQGQ